MMSSVFRKFFLLTISLTFLFVPLALELDLGGEAHAMGGGGSGNKISEFRPARGSIAKSYKHIEPTEKETQRQPAAPAPVPEPATMLLFGAGAVGLAAFKKKFNKKK